MNEIAPWIQTYTGKRFWPLEPKAEDVDIIDIAHSLSLQCRYTGHCSQFYSISEHSIYVSQIVPKEMALWGLLHDSAEAYLSDVARPVKYQIPKYKEFEEEILKVIAQKYGLDYPIPDKVKEVDWAVLHTEKKQIMPNSKYPWYLPVPPADIKIECWTPKRAEKEFLKAFNKYGGK